MQRQIAVNTAVVLSELVMTQKKVDVIMILKSIPNLQPCNKWRLQHHTTFPTATDACAGIIATTTSPLSYNLPGTYTVVWKYDDGNGN
jgi:hypothetical protein